MPPTTPSTPSPGLRTPWSQDDDAYLQAQYNPDHPGRVHAIAQHVGRTPHAVKRRAGLLGLRHPRSQQQWAPEEEQFLNNHVGSLLTTTLAKRLKTWCIRDLLGRKYTNGVRTHSHLSK